MGSRDVDEAGLSAREPSGDGTARFDFRSCRAGDEQQVLRLHERVFGSTTLRKQPMTLRHWRWKYRPEAEASACTVAVDRSTGALAGFLGGIHVPFWHNAFDVSAIHTLDHMVDPSYRRGLGKSSVFAELIGRWAHAHFGPDLAGLGFGFPSRANFRVGERVASYTQLMSVTCLVHDQAQRVPTAHPGLDGALHGLVPDDVDELWLRCRSRYPMMVARTREFLRWRYEEHPDVSYCFALIRHEGRLEALAVLRTGGVADDVVTVMDWLTAPDSGAVSAQLLALCRSFASRSRRGVLVAWQPDSSPHHDELRALGFTPRPGPWQVAGRIWDPRLTIEALQRGLILTFGDMDSL